jgi:hypothetical protein
MRGLGNVIKEEGQYKRVCSPLMVICYDWVTFPSHDKAYMGRVVSESQQEYGNSATSLNECGTITMFDMNQMLKYVTKQSKKVQAITESFEFGINDDMSNVSYNQRNRLLSIKEGTDTLKVFLENSLVDEIDDYLSKFRF